MLSHRPGMTDSLRLLPETFEFHLALVAAEKHQQRADQRLHGEREQAVGGHGGGLAHAFALPGLFLPGLLFLRGCDGVFNIGRMSQLDSRQAGRRSRRG
jgi:hypothetical protein